MNHYFKSKKRYNKMDKTENPDYLNDVINNPNYGLPKKMREIENLSNENLLQEIAAKAEYAWLRKKAILYMKMNKESENFIKERIKQEKTEGVQDALNKKLSMLENANNVESKTKK